MRARWVIGLLGFASAIAIAGEPKPTAVEIKGFRDQLVVLEDTQGGTYVVLSTKKVGDARAWFGTPKTLYEQVIVTRSANGKTGSWDLGIWSPRVPHFQPGSIQRKDDGTYHRWCGNDHEISLKLVTADRAKGILDKAKFMTSALTRRPHLLARDDAGTYYYVDVIRDQYGGSGYRVFAGKKGAMRQLPLSDVASDTAGEVFSTKSGDMRFVHENSEEHQKAAAMWIKGTKRTPLVLLDVDGNSRLIFKDLGVYSFLGTICDDL
jgi:hypothetical protein